MCMCTYMYATCRSAACRFVKGLPCRIHLAGYVPHSMCMCMTMYLQERCLPFEGFLEGLVRLSRLKALPTDSDLIASGCADAGTYVRRLKDQEGGKYRAFLEGRVNVQPVARATEHLISVIIRNIEVAVSLADRIDGKLTAVEVKKWITLMEAKKAGLVIETGTQK